MANTLLERISARTIRNEFTLNEKTQLLCFIRKKLIQSTKEEEVRQKLLSYLINEERIPLEHIEVEYVLSKFEKGINKDRSDIIIFKDDGIENPFIVVEVKAPDVGITDLTFLQGTRYLNYVKASYLVLFNGLNIVFWKVENGTAQNIVVDKFTDLFEGKFQEALNDEEWEPTSEDDIQDEKYLESYKNLILTTYCPDSRYIVCYETSFPRLRVIIRLLDLIHTRNNDFTKLNPKLVSIVEDQGDLLWKYSTFGGYVFEEHYRSLLLIDPETGNNFSMKFAIFSYNFHIGERNEFFASSHSGTYLMVGIDYGPDSLHTLEMKLDKHTIEMDFGLRLVHDGSITVRTRRKNQITLDYIGKHQPSLLKDGKIYLGDLEDKGPYSFETVNVKTFFENLIDYSFLRYKLRKALQSQKNNVEF